MRKEQQISTWMFILLNSLQKRFGIPHEAFLSIVKKYRLVHFLVEQYELLHYYDNDYIVNDIIKYIEEQGGSKDELCKAAREIA